MDSHINLAKTLGGLFQSNQLTSSPTTVSNSGLGEAVQKFEAFFIQSMLKSMRSASLSTGLFDSDQSNFYRDWHDQQLAGDLAANETFAVAKLLRGQFDAGSQNGTTGQINIKTDPLFQRSDYSSEAKAYEKPVLTASIDPILKNDIYSNNIDLKQRVTKEIKESTEITKFSNLSTPVQFVQQIYPYAQRAATKLNASADVLIAIAALETGWGMHTPKAQYGQDSFNYFGIKANNWQGSEVSNATKEFDGEKMIDVMDKFRAYESPADSFDDFAEFILSNPRYKAAVQHSENSAKFVNELQKAGYATDPNYAKKVHSILNGSILKNAIHSLNESNKSADLLSSYESQVSN